MRHVNGKHLDTLTNSLINIIHIKVYGGNIYVNSNMGISTINSRVEFTTIMPYINRSMIISGCYPIKEEVMLDSHCTMGDNTKTYSTVKTTWKFGGTEKEFHKRFKLLPNTQMTDILYGDGNE